MIILSSEQDKIVKQPVHKAIQVLASAGTGKTHVLTERVKYILKHTKKDGILALTFTNKAAKEMRLRLQDVEGFAERCKIGTIHSVAQRVLDSYSHTIGLPKELNIYDKDQDRKEIFLQSLSYNGNDNTFKKQSKQIQQYMDNFSEIKRKLLTENEIIKKYGDDFYITFKNYQEELLNSGGIDFDDIIVYAHKILIEKPWCARIYRVMYKHIFIDEGQDLNKAQYELIKALCGENKNNVMIVGDPDQMIYGFNGSSHKYLCKHFVKDFSPLKFELKQNYRSSKAVVRLANKLKPNSQKESDFALKGQSSILAFENEQKEAEWIVKKIQSILKNKTHPDIEGGISLKNFVIIVRNRFIFKKLEEILKNTNINYALKKTNSTWQPESCFGRVLDLSIRLKLNPKDWMALKKLQELLNIPVFNSKENESLFDNLLSGFNPSEVLFPELQKTVLQELKSINVENPNMFKFFDQTNKILNATSGKNSDSENQELELASHDLNELKEYWTTFKRTRPETSLLVFKKALSLGELITNGTAADTSEVLTLSTVHTMKGLEKDIVFLMGMSEGVFPDYRATNTPQKLEEEKNNAFVAVTRSKRWIFITYPKERTTFHGVKRPQQESQFLITMGGATPANDEYKNKAIS